MILQRECIQILLFTDELVIAEKVGITGAKRLGRAGKKEGDDRPRLLKLECETYEQVQYFFNSSRKLMKSRTTKDVYIGSDWTKKQPGEKTIAISYRCVAIGASCIRPQDKTQMITGFVGKLEVLQKTDKWCEIPYRYLELRS